MDNSRIVQYIEQEFVSENFFDSALKFFSAPLTPLNNDEIVLKEAIFFFKCLIDYIDENPDKVDLGYFLVKKTDFLIRRFQISSASFRSIEDKEYFNLISKKNKHCIAFLEENTTILSQEIDEFLITQTIYKEIKDTYTILEQFYAREYTYFPNQIMEKIEKIENKNNGRQIVGCLFGITVLIAIVFVFVNLILGTIFFIVGFVFCIIASSLTETPESKLIYEQNTLIDEQNTKIDQNNQWYNLQVENLLSNINTVNRHLNLPDLNREEKYLISNYIDIYQNMIAEYEEMLDYLISLST